MTTTNQIQMQNAGQAVTSDKSMQQPLNGYQVRRVKLDDHGFSEAGLNKGNARALENLLHEIKEGHLVDMNQSEQDLNRRRETLANAINEKRSAIIEQEGIADNIQEHLIPSAEQRIREVQEEIRRLESGINNGTRASNHDPLMMWVWGMVSLLLGMYLIMFYASAIHSSFFRNLLQDLMTSGNTKNISMLMNSIFDPSAVFKVQPSTVMIYLGSVLFFAIGLIANQYLHRDYTIVKKITIAIVALGLPFLADFLVAFKIHSNIVDAKAMMGVADNTPWFRSTNFWLVIVFGYIAYMAWGMVFHFFHQERARRNPVLAMGREINALREEIKSLREEIRTHQSKLAETRNLINRMNQELEQLKKQHEYILQDPDLLKHNLHQFYGGWLRYLNAGNLDQVRTECDQLFDRFLSDHFKPEVEMPVTGLPPLN